VTTAEQFAELLRRARRERLCVSLFGYHADLPQLEIYQIAGTQTGRIKEIPLALAIMEGLGWVAAAEPEFEVDDPAFLFGKLEQFIAYIDGEQFEWSVSFRFQPQQEPQCEINIETTPEHDRFFQEIDASFVAVLDRALRALGERAEAVPGDLSRPSSLAGGAR
jgi:hypothetical protein